MKSCGNYSEEGVDRRGHTHKTCLACGECDPQTGGRKGIVGDAGRGGDVYHGGLPDEKAKGEQIQARQP